MSKFYSIGYPNNYSKSPEIHEAIFDVLSLEHTFESIPVAVDDLSKFIESFRSDDETIGFSVTIPHKQAIISHLDEVSENGRVIGAVNCVKKQGNLLFGYNTDVSGFANMLKDENVDINGKRVKIIGAGGATRAVCHALMKNGASEMIIYNRTIENARKIAVEYGDIAEAKSLDDFTASDCDILVNTTSVGMTEPEESPLPCLDGISSNTVVVDIIYTPPETKLLKMAKQYGCKTINGWKMLVFQGWRADEIWFNTELIKNDSFRNSRVARRLLQQGL